MKYIPLFFFLILLQISSAQSQSQIENKVRTIFENFSYDEVIRLIDSVLNSSVTTEQYDTLNLLTYKAISAYHLWDTLLCKETFLKILEIKNNYSLDSSLASPKIVSFFNDIKNQRYKNLKQKSEVIQSQNTDEFSRQVFRAKLSKIKNAQLRNFIFPGWGNFYIGDKTKGIVLSSLFVSSLISSLYFIYDTNVKEKNYLNETYLNLIPKKYDEYNSSYKLRNISLVLLGVTYIYSQIDFILFDSRNIFETENTIFSFYFDGSILFEMNFKIPL